jgi:hypothetical protein
MGVRRLPMGLIPPWIERLPRWGRIATAEDQNADEIPLGSVSIVSIAQRFTQRNAKKMIAPVSINGTMALGFAPRISPAIANAEAPEPR